ncbi:MAG: hypothetical protein K2X39_02035 [Silvanigrellaceae bacterium]|nr:hypothetical protein [Silvanigrellaceae bacterium]
MPNNPNLDHNTDVISHSNVTIPQLAWSAFNFTVVAGLTNAAIVAVQSPVKTLLVNLTKNNSAIPSFTGGTLGFIRAMYAGTSASLSSSAARTAYVTNARNNKPGEELVEKPSKPGEQAKSFFNTQATYVMCTALGDILVTQIPESLSTLKKVPGLLPQDFKWHTPSNAYRLMGGGFGARYCSGMVNFTALCVGEEMIANNLTIENKETKHAVAGALSGMGAGLLSYPFAVFKDYSLVNMTVNNGQLVNKGTFILGKELLQKVKENPKEALGSFSKNAAKQLPIRLGLSSLIFAIVAGMGEALGAEPLKKVVPERFQPSVGKSSQGFFASSKKIEEVTAEPAPILS